MKPPLQCASVLGVGLLLSTQASPAPEGYVPPAPPAVRGAELYTEMSCNVCHSSEDKLHQLGPRLGGVFGAKRTVFTDLSMNQKRELTADDEYLREAILRPNATILANFASVMPPYAKVLKDADVTALISYIKTIPKGE